MYNNNIQIKNINNFNTYYTLTQCTQKLLRRNDKISYEFKNPDSLSETYFSSNIKTVNKYITH